MAGPASRRRDPHRRADDGSDGLRAIVESGGLAIVQDPIEAAVPAMP
jgi:hypothetical protein